MKEHQVTELISKEFALSVARKDAPTQSGDDNYPNRNTVTYYIAINTWLHLWRNFTTHAWITLKAAIATKGLLPVIGLMQDEAMRVINHEDLGPWATILYSELRFGEPKIDSELLYSETIGKDVDATVLFLLRYLKRFSPVGNDLVQQATISDFIQYENRTKLLQRSETYGYTRCVERVRKIIASMYDWGKVCSEIDNLTAQDIHFSSGSAVDASPSIGGKVKAIVEDGNHSDYIMPIMGVYTLNRYAAHDLEPRVSHVRAVPKSYKSSRIIAMERTYPIARGKAIELIFRKYDKICKTGINLEDQSVNQYYAQLGSVDGSIATLDASHASDLQSKSLFIDLFPYEYSRRVHSLLPEYCEISGKGVRVLQMNSTSGHTLTFRHETIIYKAIAQAALEVTRDLGISVSFPLALAYGDDTLVSSEAYDAAVYMFSRLGLIINEDKSYATGDFRESCGKDYINGVDVSSIYYPRFPVIGSFSGDRVSLDSSKVFNDEYRGKLDNSLTMLIDLQKKIFPYSYEGACLVSSIVREAYPSITASVKGTVCNDLWDYIDTGKAYVPTAWSVESKGNKISHLRLPIQVAEFSALGSAENMLSGSTAAEFRRCYLLDTIHVYPSVAFQSQDSFTDKEVAIYEYWRYTTFLREGPQYEDELCRLLKVSQRPMSINEFYGKRTLKLHRAR